ncbi:hypothetical protein [Saccharopolyspora thermophila]|uniref:hypothetical protein n=1 Tax=Saccharopolyspora thermophila TaxID=89367 RepID=UPI001E5A2BC1|nr:hypothetical protein [Saccharopolyspora subtropica]
MIDPLADTAPVGGLHKFDLGMVPASVTPPRTWRHAAWFVIASAAAALGGLVLVSAIATDGRSSFDGLELPSMPRGEYPRPSADPYYLAGDPTRSAAPRPTGEVRPLPPAVVAEAPRGAPPTSSAAAPGADSAAPSPTPTAQPSTSRAPYVAVLTDTEAMRQRAEAYFAAINRGDLRGAYAMTAGALRAEGYDAFAAEYANVDSVEVVDVFATPASTVHTLRVTQLDGSVRTQRRELRYTSGNDPLVSSDEQLR